MTIGHPDYQETIASGVPRLIQQLGSFAAGASWGPVTIAVPSGGQYLITLAAVTLANVAASDITIQHLDPGGTVVYTDFFGAVWAGNGLAPVTSMPGPTMIRGNIYGSTLKITGQCANSAWINGIQGGAGLTASACLVRLYSMPAQIADPEPRMCNGSGLIGANIGNTPSGLLTTIGPEALPPGTNSVKTTILPYAGPATLSVFQQGDAATPTNIEFQVYGLTVGNGAGVPVYQRIYRNPGNIIGYSFPLDIPACMANMQIYNFDGAQTANCQCTLTASKVA